MQNHIPYPINETPDDPGQCSHEQYFDDMYPEFAPDPIRIVCTQPATCLLVGWDMTQMPADFLRIPYCLEHAEQNFYDPEIAHPHILKFPANHPVHF